MKILLLRLFAIVLIFHCFNMKIWSQLDNKSYFSPLHGSSYTSDAKQYLYLSTPETTPFQVEIKDGGGTILAMPYISKLMPYEYYFGSGDNTRMMVTAGLLNEVLTNKGVKVAGSKKFFCDFRVDEGDQAGSMTAKGGAALGTKFRLGNLPQVDDGAHFASVMATENNTVVTFSNFAPGIKLRNGGSSFTPPSSISVTLNDGETYVIAMYGSNNDDAAMFNGLFGVLVNSTKPISVNCGSWFASPVGYVSTTGDIGFDQIVPLSKVGKEYIVMQGEGPSILETAVVVAHSNNTKVYLHGNSAPYATLNAGGRVEIPMSQYVNGCMYIRADNDVFVYQALGGGPSHKNGAMNFVPPLSCQLPSCIDNISNINSIGSTNYSIQIYILAANGTNVTVNTNTGPPPVLSGPVSVSGNLDYVVYTAVSVQGNATICSNGPIQVCIAAVDDKAGWGGYYSGFEEVFIPEIEIIPNAQCPDTLFLKMKHIGGITWYKDGQIFAINDSIIPVNQPGNYMVVGYDTTFCGEVLADTSYYTVYTFPAYQVSVADAPCFGFTGQISITPNDLATNYTYSWSSGLSGPIQTLPAGQYTVTVASGNGCEITSIVDIEQPDQLVLLTTPDTLMCSGNGVILMAYGKFPDFMWTGGVQGETLTITSPGTYTVTATDSNGCTVAESITVANYPNLDVTITGDLTTCPGATSALSGPSGPSYLYEWSNGETVATINVPIGTYGLTITDANGCTGSTSIVISEMLLRTEKGHNYCYQGNKGWIKAEAESGVPPYQYSIIPEPFGVAAEFNGLKSGAYIVAVQDASGCILADTVFILEKRSAPYEIFVTPGDTLVELSQVLSFELTPSFPTEKENVEWHAPFALDCAGCFDPSGTPLNDCVVQVWAADVYGCPDTAQMRIRVEKNYHFYAPNIFQPDAQEEANSLWSIFLSPEQVDRVLYLRVFDRWGEMVFEHQNYQVGDQKAFWDGCRSGQQAEAGVYVWQARVRFIDGFEKDYGGDVTLWRSK